MLDIRPILMVNGILLGILAAAMLIPAGVDLFYGNNDWQIFLLSAAITGFFGMSLYLTNRGSTRALTIRQAFLFTASSWFFLPVFAGLPFLFSDLGLSFTDAYFETVSGLTTTGSTVIVGLDSAPPGILFWRALLCGLGGVGIVVLALAILPTLRIGGMQLFRTESSDNADKIFPRVTQVAATIATVFCALCSLCALSFWLAGMSGFDAICHALTAIATAGFSTHDASFAYFNSPAIEAIAMLFMISGALPLMLYFRVFKEGINPFWMNSQVRSFLWVIVVVTTMLVFWLVLIQEQPFLEAFRNVSFSVISIITTTGYTTTDYNGWGSFVIPVMFFLSVVGGCTGSTAGGIKIFRFQVLYEIAKSQIRQLLQPHGVFIPHYNGKQIPDHVTSSVMSFFTLFAFVFTVLVITMSFFGPDFITSMSGIAQAMANVGPGLGPIIGPVGNFATIPDGAKWVLSFAMIVGRLELFTVLVLFSPHFWRD